jgi:hypothetical protein
MNQHYICTGGCQGISEVPASCRMESCPRRGLELKECSCDDHNHWGAFQSKKTKSGTILVPSAFALALGITITLAAIVNGLAALILSPNTNTTLTLTDLIINGLVAGVGGLIAGAVIAWFYNHLRR